MTMKICGVCNQVFTRGGTGPKKMPLCSAHFHRYRRGSKSWKDPSIRGDGVDLARVRISQSARDELESMFTDAKKKRPALTFHEFFDLLVQATSKVTVVEFRKKERCHSCGGDHPTGHFSLCISGGGAA